MIELITIIAIVLVLLGVISFGGAAMFIGKLVIGGIVISIGFMILAMLSSRGE